MIYFLQELHTYSYNNETSSVILFDTLIFSIFNTLYLKRVLSGKLSLFTIANVIDYYYAPQIRYSFTTATVVNFIVFIKTYIRMVLLNTQNFCNIRFTRTKQYTTVINTYSANRITSKFSNLIIIKTQGYTKRLVNISSVFYALVKPVNVVKSYSSVCATLLRKNRVYTKSKYSRARQYCRNIVLLGLLLNIILMNFLKSFFQMIL